MGYLANRSHGAGLARNDPELKKPDLHEAKLGFFILIPHTIKGLDSVKRFICFAELLPKSFDMAIDCAVIDINLIIVSGVHQLVSGLHIARTFRQRL